MEHCRSSDRQTAGRGLCPGGSLYELVHQFMIDRKVDAKNIHDLVAILGMLVSNGITPGTSPLTDFLSPPTEA